jgi:hypothetical protein
MWEAGQFGTLQGASADEASLGTRFRLFPQVPHLSGYSTPETVWIEIPPDHLQPGPSDERIYVRDPIVEKEPYEFPMMPPYVGDVYPPAEAGPDGHFDHLEPNSRQFVAAHAYASVRRVLDVWESYLAHPIVWHFADTYERLEIIPSLDWNNAQSGYGYLELGQDRAPDGRTYPYALNFDVIAHEVGHAILFSLFGVPTTSITEGDYAPFHEASADLISLLSFLHFDSGVERLLRHCNGNLLVLNELNRIAELVGDRQIRLASNSRRMSEVTDEVHDRSRPFTGAIFDAIVDDYHARLVKDGLADAQLLDVDIREVDEPAMERISTFTKGAFRSQPFQFKSALVAARDDVARALAMVWPRLDPNDLTFESVALELLDVCAQYEPTLVANIEENFRWREIL